MFSKLIPISFQRCFLGIMILTAEGLDKNSTGLVSYFEANEPVCGSDSKDRLIIGEGGRWSKSVEILPGKHISCMLDWSESNFSRFAFDLLAVMNGTYRQRFISSWHGMTFVVP